MKGVRFYEEFTNRRRTKSDGNVVAVLVANGSRVRDGERFYDAIGSVYASPNSPVGSTTCAATYLRRMCKRVSEARAREIHPNLFALLRG